MAKCSKKSTFQELETRVQHMGKYPDLPRNETVFGANYFSAEEEFKNLAVNLNVQLVSGNRHGHNSKTLKRLAVDSVVPAEQMQPAFNQ